MSTNTRDSLTERSPVNFDVIKAPIGNVHDWAQLFEPPTRFSIEEALRRYLPSRRWFGGKAKTIGRTSIVDTIRTGLATNGRPVYVVILQVEYAGSTIETYVCPLAIAVDGSAEKIVAASPEAIVARLKVDDRSSEAILFDAMIDTAFAEYLLESIRNGTRTRGKHGELSAASTAVIAQVCEDREALSPQLSNAEQSNSAILYGDKLILKLFRKVEPGTNPDLEIGRFLLAHGFKNTAPVAGDILYQHADGGEPMTVALLQQFVPNEGTGWKHALDVLHYQFNRLLVEMPSPEAIDGAFAGRTPLDLWKVEPPDGMREHVGEYLPYAKRLGLRTAELHATLASDDDHPSFAPAALSPSYQRALHRSIHDKTVANLRTLKSRLGDIDPEARAAAERLLQHENALLSCLRGVEDHPLSGSRIRCHGDYHLGQVLFTSDDYVIIDFEGEPARPLNERREKHSPLLDIAGMLRSYDYAAAQAVRRLNASSRLSVQEQRVLDAAARAWYRWNGAAFLNSYFCRIDSAGLLPESQDELRTLLHALLLEKGMYEVAYELNNRPDWVAVPIRGVLEILDAMHCAAT